MLPCAPGGTMESIADLTERRSRELAVEYRNLVLCFGGQLALTALNIWGNLGLQGAAAELLRAIVSIGMLGSAAALTYFGYRTARAMGSGVSWLWALGMLVPCVNVLTLLVLSSRATQMCRTAGNPVGFLGPKLPSRPSDPGSGGDAA